MNVKSNVSNTFSYNGSVNISLKTKGRIYPFSFHNTGTKLLLDTVTKALCGEDISDSRPTHLDIQHLVAGKYVSALKSPVPLTGAVWGTAAQASPNEGVVLVNGVITEEDKEITVGTLTSPKLVITTDSGGILASIDSSNIQTMFSSITESTDALIEWRMIFTCGGTN